MTRAELIALAERVEGLGVKALSIKQPYPHHIFHDGKDVENRDWPTKGRGWFIVHAGVSKSELDMSDPSDAALPRGGVVGMARMLERAGPTFDDGSSIAEYADETGPTYWDEEWQRESGPEQCADDDMSYWGEE